MSEDPRRFVAAARARQGGFSTVALPAPAQYAGTPPPAETRGILLVPSSGFDAENRLTGLATNATDIRWLTKMYALSDEFGYYQRRNYAFIYQAASGPNSTGLLMTPIEQSGTALGGAMLGDLAGFISGTGPVDAYADSNQFNTEFFTRVSTDNANSFSEPQPNIPGASYSQFTLESIVKLGPSNQDADQSELFFYVSSIVERIGYDNSPGVGLILEADPQTSGGNFSSMKWSLTPDLYNLTGTLETVDGSSLIGGSFAHVAIVRDADELRFYANGTLRYKYTNLSVDVASNDVLSLDVIARGAHASKVIETEEGFTYLSNPLGFHGLRVTAGQALYSGTSFTPPTTITALA